MCECLDGLKGDMCNDDIDECLESFCYGDFICVNEFGIFWCLCELYWLGKWLGVLLYYFF